MWPSRISIRLDFRTGFHVITSFIKDVLGIIHVRHMAPDAGCRAERQRWDAGHGTIPTIPYHTCAGLRECAQWWILSQDGPSTSSKRSTGRSTRLVVSGCPGTRWAARASLICSPWEWGFHLATLETSVREDMKIRQRNTIFFFQLGVGAVYDHTEFRHASSKKELCSTTKYTPNIENSTKTEGF